MDTFGSNSEARLERDMVQEKMTKQKSLGMCYGGKPLKVEQNTGNVKSSVRTSITSYMRK